MGTCDSFANNDIGLLFGKFNKKRDSGTVVCSFSDHATPSVMQERSNLCLLLRFLTAKSCSCQRSPSAESAL